jgi:hypothetical protein
MDQNAIIIDANSLSTIIKICAVFGTIITVIGGVLVGLIRYNIKLVLTKLEQIDNTQSTFQKEMLELKSDLNALKTETSNIKENFDENTHFKNATTKDLSDLVAWKSYIEPFIASLMKERMDIKK